MERTTVDVMGSSDREALEQRFWSRVDRSGGSDDCWRWTGALYRNGYGQFYAGADSRSVSTHRLAFALANGGIPKGALICHTCDNRQCCNPRHMFLGTNADNLADMARKGRSLKGESNTSAKLTDADARRIVEEAGIGVRGAELARRFDVTRSAIHHILRGNTWSHATGIQQEARRAA